jgi:dienelactone hydrolase
MWRLLRRALVLLALLVSSVMFLVVSTPQGQAAASALLFIPQVLPAVGVRPQSWVTREPVRTQIEFPSSEGAGLADLYVPAGSGTHSAVLFFMGVVPPDRDETRIVRLANGLARAGFVVMIPWLETQATNRIVPDDIDRLVDAFLYLRGLDRVDPDRVGMGGICTGASMVTVASQDERIRSQVRFINFFAGYFDAGDLVKSIGTRTRFYGGETRPWSPDSLTMELFTYHLIDGVSDPNDRALLTRAFVEQKTIVPEALKSLSVEGMAVHRLISGTGFDDVDAVMEQLSPRTKEFLRMISPSTNIDMLEARVLVMHDRGDRLVPSEESRRLVEAIGDRGKPYHTEFSGFQREIQVHVDESQSVGVIGYVREAFKLFKHMYVIMREVS